MKKREKRGFLVPFLFIIYIVLLVWIILFKLQFSISGIDKIRSINLIPFHYENEIGMNFHLNEILENAAIFIPLGIYLCMFRHEWNVKAKKQVNLIISILAAIVTIVVIGLLTVLLVLN